jgi:formamidopyrimidine-DNA glycosylase
VLTILFSNDLSLVVHFKLAGQFAVLRPDGERAYAGHPVPAPKGDYPHKTTHLTLRFDDGTVAYYSDVRQFGWMRLMPSEDVAAVIEQFGFGPEGTLADPIDTAALAARLARRTVPIKASLLDQGLIAGLGNIYVDEALFAARVHPARPSDSIDAAEIAALAETIPWALDRGIEQGGAKIIHSKAYPIDGFPQVHARQGEPCVVCGTAIVKTRVGGRGTYYCPTCQPDPPGWVRPPATVPKVGKKAEAELAEREEL